MDKLSLDLDNQEELIQVSNSLILPPTINEEEKSSTQEEADVGMTNYQKKEEEYDQWQRIYVEQLGDEESDSDSDNLSFSYYGF